ncbi:MAG: histidine kinase [Lachnospiraceae bacterium]|nr:histidine kinase [Lachnospiraceae bacterium]
MRTYSLGRDTKAEESIITEHQKQLFISQFNPHFLFNALNLIKGYAYVEPRTAGLVVDDFSVYLRGCIEVIKNPKVVPFSWELEKMNAYIRIEEKRFYNLEVNIDIEHLDFMVPGMTILPFVKEAVNRAVYTKEEVGQVFIHTLHDGENSKIIIEDNGGEEEMKYLKGMGISQWSSILEKDVDAQIETEQLSENKRRLTITIPDEKEIF